MSAQLTETLDLTGPDDDEVIGDKEHAQLEIIEAELTQIHNKISKLVGRKRALEAQREAALAAGRQHRRPRQDWSGESAWDAAALQLLSSVFKLPGFRPLQREVINCTMSGASCVCLLPSGGGKSLCYQLPALLSEPGAITLVVSPLLSHIQDQTLGLKALGIGATALTSLTSKEGVAEVYKQMDDANIRQLGPDAMRLLYVTPERVVNAKRFIGKLGKLYKSDRLARIAIDEAHCCSQWGNDFRPDYRKLGFLRQQFPDTPILALTATATEAVCKDVQTILGIDGCEVFRSSIDRPNLFYEVRQKPSTAVQVADAVIGWIQKTQADGATGIVYCLSCKDTEVLASQLSARGLPAAPYHAQMDPQLRPWMCTANGPGELRIICATVAFGMGINMTSVRFVVHQTMSKSLEAYYQESGRAGRDGLPARCLLLYRFADVLRLAAMGNQEHNWQSNLMSMAAYATAHECRRKMLCRHFGEEAAPCGSSCCTCAGSEQTTQPPVRDVSGEACGVLAALAGMPVVDKRATLLQLIDLWRGLKADEVAGGGAVAGKAFSRDDNERLLGHLLQEGVLCLDFGYTAYSCICYLKAGSGARHMLQGATAMHLSLPLQSATSKKRKAASAGSQPC